MCARVCMLTACLVCVQLVGDPDLGFSGLRQFGTSLISHVNMKVRQDIGVTGLMVVDSPGMIDSPVNSGIGKPSTPSHARVYAPVFVYAYA